MLWSLVPVSVGAVLFLLWFGNYTASMYRDLYGRVPTPPQMESEPKPREASRALQNYIGFSNFVTCVASCISAPVFYSAKVLNRDWTARISDSSDA